MKMKMIGFLVMSAISVQVFADPSSNLNSNSSTAVSGSNATGVVSNPNANAASMAGVVDSPVTASIKNGDISAATGASNAATGPIAIDSSMKLTFEGSRSRAGAVLPSTPGTSTPQLFGQLSETANVKGGGLALLYQQVCGSKSVRGYLTADIELVGISGKTSIIFTPHIDYLRTERKLRGLTRDDENVRIVPEKEHTQEARVVLNGSGNFKCLGIATISADSEKAGKVPFPTIVSDIEAFPTRMMVGYQNVILLSSRSAIAATVGVDSRGGGLGFTTGVSKLLGLSTGALGLGASSSDGVTFPVSQFGGTFLVVVEDKDGVFIDLSDKKPEPVAEKASPVTVPLITQAQLDEEREAARSMRATIDGVNEKIAELEKKQADEEAARVLKEKQKAQKARKAAQAKRAQQAIQKPVQPPSVTLPSPLFECKGCDITVTQKK